jgi:AraC-like DNA-binding protein
MAVDSLIRVRNARATSLGGVVLAGHIRASTGLPEEPMRVLGSYAVVYLLTGGGRFADGSGFATTVTAGDLLLLFPDVPHSYGPLEAGHWSELYIMFEGPVFDLWRDVGLLDPARPIHHLEPVDQWSESLSKVLSPHPRPGISTALAEICRLQTVLAEAIVGLHHGDQAGSEDQRWLASATALLEADTRREARLEDIAGQLGYTYHGFRKRFRRLAGMSPSRYRSMRSIDRACELMAEARWSDREIAAKLGYSDEFHFSHRFKELTGRTPRQFRAALPLR